jgi:hypothetical protein
VKIVSGSFDCQHAYVFAGVSIDRGAQFRSGYLTFDLNARDLPFSVNARVSTTGTVNIHAATVNQ